MDKKSSFTITATLSGIISSQNPAYSFTAKELKNAKKEYSPEEISALTSMGWFDGDFEKFFVVSRFLSENSAFDTAPDEYITEVFKNACKFSTVDFNEDEYIKNVRVEDTKIGKFHLTTSSYEGGELFLYDAPDFSADIIVPKLGFFTGKVTFPTLYEGDMPWMSVCPSEINSMKEQTDAAFGKVLVLGCGLGYYQFCVSGKENVESVTVVEISDTIADIFESKLLPYFPNRDKIRVIRADAIEYMKEISEGEYDFVFADIWEGIVDGAPLYEKIKVFEKSLPSTVFTYWIEDQIRFYLEENAI